MEANYAACFEVTQEVVWLRNFIFRFNLVESIMISIIIYCDNTIVVSFSQNNNNSTCRKHFDIKYQFIKEKICKHLTYIKHVSIMFTNLPTKGLVIEMFIEHVVRMGLAKSFDILG